MPAVNSSSLENTEVGNVSVLIVDDSKSYCKVLSEILDKKPGLQVVGTAFDGLQAIKLINRLKPDVVLLDLIMPRLDGIGVLEKYATVTDKPKFIVLSGFVQDEIVSRSFELGISFFIMKPFDHNILAERIKDFSTSWNSSAVVKKTRGGTDLDNEVASIMYDIGVPVHIKGYNYLKESIKKACEDKSLLGALTKELYPMIAEQFETTPSKVERSIRNAIKLACTRGNIEMIRSIFQYSAKDKVGKPTNGQFISTIADRIISKTDARFHS